MYCGTQNKMRKNIFEKEHLKIIDEDGWINEIKIWSSAGEVSVKKLRTTSTIQETFTSAYTVIF